MTGDAKTCEGTYIAAINGGNSVRLAFDAAAAALLAVHEKPVDLALVPSAIEAYERALSWDAFVAAVLAGTP